MSNLIRWEPMREFLSVRESMDRLFDDLYSRQAGVLRETGIPAVDLYQDDESVVLKAALPGIKAEDIQVSVTGDVLLLRGEVKREEETKGVNYHISERSYGSFSRSIPLPAPVIAEQARAEFENGILTLRLPKAEEIKPKTITVKTK